MCESWERQQETQPRRERQRDRRKENSQIDWAFAKPHPHSVIAATPDKLSHPSSLQTKSASSIPKEVVLKFWKQTFDSIREE